MSHVPKGGWDSSHRSAILWRFSESEVATRRVKDCVVRERRKKKGGSRRESNILPSGWKKKCAESSERVKTCAAHICITERIKHWREMKTRESILLGTLLRSWLTILQKSLCIFLPQGLEKHLTLLTSLPEKARVRDRQKFQDVGKVAGKRWKHYKAETSSYNGNVNNVMLV